MINRPAADDRTCVIGLMAGTSLDGVDAALVELADPTRPRCLGAVTTPYGATLRQQLRDIGPDTALHAIVEADGLVADAFAEAARAVLTRTGTAAARVRAIASHGQSVWHAPLPPWHTTVQIGDPNRIAEHTGLDVVSDFRRRDMAAGGEGAPLAPLFHAGLFASAEEDRVVVNLGGIANITALPRGGAVSGFDTGPANTLLDAWHHRHRGGTCDADGAWAATGQVVPELLDALRRDAFFQRPPPRSTGPEHFNLRWLQQAMDDRALAPRDVQATLAELTAQTVADGIDMTLPAAARVIVCGGGAFNGDLMTRIRRAVAGKTVVTADDHGIAPDQVEAVGFAWLGYRTLCGLTGNLRSVTGARHEVILGGIYQGG